MLLSQFVSHYALSFICSPKDHLEFTIVRDSIRRKMEASSLFCALIKSMFTLTDVLVMTMD